jgi:ligand-binding SRPBCC domain-containing protein
MSFLTYGKKARKRLKFQLQYPHLKRILMSYEISLETKIDVKVETLFEFHQNPKNLPLITPKNIEVSLINIPEPFEEKGVVVLNITKWGITQQWEVELNRIVYPTLIRDVALKSPFKHFVHDHIFKPLTSNSSMLCDKISITLPFEPLSHLILPLVKRDILAMFEYRHKTTKRILESIA